MCLGLLWEFSSLVACIYLLPPPLLMELSEFCCALGMRAYAEVTTTDTAAGL